MNSAKDSNASTQNLFEEIFVVAVDPRDEVSHVITNGLPHKQIYLFTISLIGILLNMVVILKYIEISRQPLKSSVRNSINILACMAVADTVTLLALMLAFLEEYTVFLDHHPSVLNAICKIYLFVIHWASAFSIWCWTLLSVIRYLAIYKPFRHLRINYEPIILMVVMVAVCCVLELWILFDIAYIVKLGMCGHTLHGEVGKIFYVIEIFCSYFLPLILISFFDCKVLCYKPKHKNAFRMRTISSTRSTFNSSGSLIRKKYNYQACKLANSPSISLELSENVQECDEISETKKKNFIQKCSKVIYGKMLTEHKPPTFKSTVIKRCLFISILNIILNLPNYIVRLHLTLVDANIILGSTFIFIQDISQLIYFAQYALNALYFFGIVYDMPGNTMRQR